MTPAKLLCEWLHNFVVRADFDSLVQFENAASYINGWLRAGSRPLCLLASIVTLWLARTWFAALWRADCAALCCAVLIELNIRYSTTRSYMWKKKNTKTYFLKKKAHPKRIKKREKARRQGIVEGVQVGALRGERSAKRARWGRKKKIRKSLP